MVLFSHLLSTSSCSLGFALCGDGLPCFSQSAYAHGMMSIPTLSNMKRCRYQTLSVKVSWCCLVSPCCNHNSNTLYRPTCLESGWSISFSPTHLRYLRIPCEGIPWFTTLLLATHASQWSVTDCQKWSRASPGHAQKKEMSNLRQGMSKSTMGQEKLIRSFSKWNFELSCGKESAHRKFQHSESWSSLNGLKSLLSELPSSGMCLPKPVFTKMPCPLSVKRVHLHWFLLCQILFPKLSFSLKPKWWRYGNLSLVFGLRRMLSISREVLTFAWNCNEEVWSWQALDNSALKSSLRRGVAIDERETMASASPAILFMKFQNQSCIMSCRLSAALAFSFSPERDAQMHRVSAWWQTCSVLFRAMDKNARRGFKNMGSLLV